MSTPTNGVEYAALIGLDWGSRKHALTLREAGSRTAERFTLEQTPEALHDWLGQLRIRFEGRPVAIAIEQSRGAVIHALLGYEFVHIYQVNPLSSARYRQSFSVGGAKDDPTDADCLLEMLACHRDRLRLWVPEDPETRALQRLVEFRREMVGRRTALTNQLTQLLKEYFPQALEWAGDLDREMACDFLLRWPTLEQVQRARSETVRTFYRGHGSRSRKRIEERLVAISVARDLTRDGSVVRTSALIVQTLIPTLRTVIDSIRRIDQEIQDRFHAHPDAAVFADFPGAGAVMAPRLLAAMGADRSRFHSAAEVQTYSGIAPVTERSGDHVRIHRRYACPKFLKQTFHEHAGLSIQWCSWARTFYDRQRQAGKGHHAAVRSLAYKWIRIIFRCWVDRTAYNEETYLRSLRAKGSPLVNSSNRAA